MKATIVIVLILTILLVFTNVILVREVYRLRGRIATQEDNYEHLLHRTNAIEYHEVLGK